MLGVERTSLEAAPRYSNHGDTVRRKGAQLHFPPHSQAAGFHGPHYLPFCSKINPIGYRPFSQISCSLSGAPLLFVENAVERATATTTKTGLIVYVDINN